GVDGVPDRTGDGDAGQSLFHGVGDGRVLRPGPVGILQLVDERRTKGVGDRRAGDVRDDPADDRRTGVARAGGELAGDGGDGHDRLPVGCPGCPAEEVDVDAARVAGGGCEVVVAVDGGGGHDDLEAAVADPERGHVEVHADEEVLDGDRRAHAVRGGGGYQGDVAGPGFVDGAGGIGRVDRLPDEHGVEVERARREVLDYRS